VTDADVLLGFIDPDFFLGGEIQIDKVKAEAAIVAEIGDPLSMGPHEAALAISDIVNNNMSNAMHFVTTKRGFDPRDFALLAVGGAGAIHAGRQAEDLGIETVVVPSLGPVFCALGDDVAHLKVSEARTHYQRLDEVDLDHVNALFQEMEAAARARLGGQTVTQTYETSRGLDMRYVGEVHEVTVPVRSRTRRITALNVEATLADFHDLHDRLYAHKDASQAVEVLTVRLELVGLRARPRVAEEPFESEDASAAIKGERPVYFEAEPTLAPVYDGSRLRAGNFIAGPAIIEQWGTTVVVHPGHEALIDAFRNCVIEVRRESRGPQATPAT
jgi:N-methylhydantoinase A